MRWLFPVFLYMILLGDVLSIEDLHTESAIISPENRTGAIIIYLHSDADEVMIKNTLVNMVISLPAGTYEVDIMTDAEGKFGLALEDDEEIGIEFRGDSLVTQGRDYYGQYEFDTLPSGTRIGLFKVGSIKGLVVDRLENIVPNAELKIMCDNSLGELPPKYSDRFGSFEYDYAPVGRCRVF